MWKFLSPAIILLVMLAAAPAGALTVKEAQVACDRELSGYTYRESSRTGVTRMQKMRECVQQKMRAAKGAPRKTG